MNAYNLKPECICESCGKFFQTSEADKTKLCKKCFVPDPVRNTKPLSVSLTKDEIAGIKAIAKLLDKSVSEVVRIMWLHWTNRDKLDEILKASGKDKNNV